MYQARRDIIMTILGFFLILPSFLLEGGILIEFPVPNLFQVLGTTIIALILEKYIHAYFINHNIPHFTDKQIVGFVVLFSCVCGHIERFTTGLWQSINTYLYGLFIGLFLAFLDWRHES